SVASFAGRREARDDDVGLKSADGPDDVREDAVVAPDGERFVRTFGETEVEGAGEHLLRAVNAPRREQLLRADHAEELALFIADEILPAVAARQREVAGAVEAIVRPVRKERR